MTAAATLLTAVGGCAAAPDGSLRARDGTSAGATDSVVIRRTADGIPHIKASNWAALGYGYGYAQASDNLCTMAEAFVTYRGERSRYFGPDGVPAARSTLGAPKNLDSDFFFRLVASDQTIEHYRDSQPDSLKQLTRGFAAGYDRYLDDLRAGRAPGRHDACSAAPWVTDITDADLYRRLYAANLAGGESRFVSAIANAHPPRSPRPSPLPHAGEGASTVPAHSADTLAGLDPDTLHVGGHFGIGSNGIAFGADATGGEPILFGNPHWFWSGPDRFYQAQLTIPGKLNVAGVSFLGVPVVMIGYNDDVAWTHTVSSARRFGIFQLTLAQDDPTAYLLDGKRVAMTPVPLTVQARQADGSLVPVTRTLYQTSYGPLVNLSTMSPALGWTQTQAFAIRDVNHDNTRIFQTFLKFGQARSLDALIAAEKTSAAMPWVNTVAIGRADPNVWYADIGNVPDVSDALADKCTTPAGKAFDTKLPGVPFLDGSRSECDWQIDPAAAQPGSLPAAAMPGLLRRDYVANMNNSYWLANPAAPLTGFPRVMGPGVAPLDLRARLGLQLAQQAFSATPIEQGAAAGGAAGAGAAGGAEGGSGQTVKPVVKPVVRHVSAADVRRFTLDGTSLSAQRFKPAVLDQVCTSAHIEVAKDPSTGQAFTPPRIADTTAACDTLRTWDGTGSVDARGAYLWDEFWARASRIAPSRLYRTPFNPADPLHTPADIRANDPDIAQAFGAAILAVTDAGFTVDAKRGDTLFITRDGKPIPLYGGCAGVGYFTSVCLYDVTLRAGSTVTANEIAGNSYIQVVTFGSHGVDAATLLSHSESDDPASPHFSDGTRRYAAQRWLRVPFHEREIASDPDLQVTRLTMPAADGAGTHAASNAAKNGHDGEDGR